VNVGIDNFNCRQDQQFTMALTPTGQDTNGVTLCGKRTYHT
jgi:hypothetical protein